MELSKACSLEYVNANKWNGEVIFNHFIDQINDYKFMILLEKPAKLESKISLPGDFHWLLMNVIRKLLATWPWEQQRTVYSKRSLFRSK